MPKRQAGASLIICGVVLAFVPAAVAIIGGTATIAISGRLNAGSRRFGTGT